MIQPMLDYVIIKVDDAPEQVNLGGIIMPESSKKTQCISSVIAVGANTPISLSWKIVYKPFTGYEFLYDHSKYLCIHKNDIVAYITE